MDLASLNVQEGMTAAIAEVLENMAFMEALPGTEANALDPDEPVFYTRLPIYKPSPSTVGIVVPQALALSLAGTLMMKECTMEEDEFEVLDVLSELTNTLAGSLLTHLLPQVDSFELGLPECRVIGDWNHDKEWADCEEYIYHIDEAGFYCLWRCD
jgi:hypothetical protein